MEEEEKVSVITFEAEARLNNISESNPYLKENATLQYYVIKLLILFKEIIAVYTENHTESINIKCSEQQVSIVSDYRQDGQENTVRSPGRGKGLLPTVLLRGPLSLLTNGYRGPFPGVKRGRSVTLTIHPI
jgi:hypothetical protein